MKDYSYVFNAHPSFIEAMYLKFKADPSSVEDGWRSFFEGFDFGQNGNGHLEEKVTSSVQVTKEFGVLSIIYGFRQRGHLLSDTNPVRQRRDRKPHLSLPDHGLEESDLDRVFVAGEEVGLKNATLRQIIDKLQTIYSGPVGIEYSHIENKEKRLWVRKKMEERALSGGYGLSLEKKKRILEKLNGAVVFEKFLHTKYVGQKRFSLEGGESTIAALDAIINLASEDKVEEVVIGMAHRGRLNVLANIMGKTYEQIFNEFEGTAVPDLSFGDGDVKYHLGYSSQVENIKGTKVNLKLAPNPSHLEAVNPVVEGFSRAKADILYGSDYDKILPILIHGDAAIAGQGVVYETVQMSQLDGYFTGGTIHFVINNQIGFTTDWDEARSSTYCTGVASIIQAPVFHVNGDAPEAVIWAVELATEYRQKFNNDVFIDMVCYRKHGHNEGDDPKFTQPQLYNLISTHPDPREIYIQKLVSRDHVEKKLAEDMQEQFWNDLQNKLDLVKENPLPYTYQEPEQEWRKLNFVNEKSKVNHSPKTGIPKTQVNKIIDHLMVPPKGFTPLSKIKRLQKGKQALLDQGQVDWALAELIAYGSILLEGKDVRMSGQDVKRGTFSHRHAIFRDAKTFETLNRLMGMDDDQGRFMIYNSLLSEFAVLGFEYGYSLASPNSLVLWEAQFGDFYNGAQTIVDQFISAGESKWRRMSGLVMLLPHGYAGQGPEHSSARLERFLLMCAEFNIIVANISTPANFFHVLRRQLAQPFRKPLVVMSPKSLLRHPHCVSNISDLYTSTSFQPIIEDDAVKSKVKKVLFCSGKIYYDLLEKKTEESRDDVALVRIEQLYPLPEKEMRAIFNKYPKATYFWVQEEPKNMGAWNYMLNFFRNDALNVICRKASASPASGFKAIHDQQQKAIVEEAFA
jgi:2-oxoglutarate dehydrogenase E1 component